MTMFNKKFALILPALALVLAGCTNVTTPTAPVAAPTTSTSAAAPSSTPTASTAPTKAPAKASTKTVEGELNALTVKEESGSDSYERTNFKHWVSENNTGCDTRYAVLVQESLTKPVTSGCSVISGKWISAYDGKTFTNPSGMDIDHMVPLSEAWRSGANTWTAERRQAYANDLSNPNALVAVSANANRSKGDQDPSDWMPASDACDYLTMWVSVKYEWKLTVDADEKADITKFLSFCAKDLPATVVTPQPAPVTSTPAVAPTSAPAPTQSVPAATGGNDPDFGTCTKATAAGYGPYKKGIDPEYAFYRDGDGDGTVCE